MKPRTENRLMTALTALFMAVVLANAICCATLKPCTPSTAEDVATIGAILDNPTLSNALAVAELEALKVAPCVITAIAKSAVDKAETLKFSTPASTTSAMFQEPPRVTHSRAWLAKHP